MNIGGFLKRNTLGIVLLLGFSGCTSVIFNSVYQHAVVGAYRSSCQSNLHDIMKACQVYQADYEGRYPPLSSASSQGWTQLLQEAGPGIHLNFRCAAGYKSSFSPTSDYFYNARLATRRSSLIKSPEWTITFGDGPDNGSTNSHYWELPNDREDPDSPLLRHLWGANYALSDGHVKFLRPQRATEWVSNTDDLEEWHYKFAPTESAVRLKHQPTPTSLPRPKGQHESNHATPSAKMKN